MAKDLKTQGILDTKPYSSNPKKDRSKLLTKWIAEYKLHKYDQISTSKDVITLNYSPVTLEIPYK